MEEKHQFSLYNQSQAHRLNTDNLFVELWFLWYQMCQLQIRTSMTLHVDGKIWRIRHIIKPSRLKPPPNLDKAFSKRTHNHIIYSLNLLTRTHKIMYYLDVWWIIINFTGCSSSPSKLATVMQVNPVNPAKCLEESPGITWVTQMPLGIVVWRAVHNL